MRAIRIIAGGGGSNLTEGWSCVGFSSRIGGHSPPCWGIWLGSIEAIIILFFFSRADHLRPGCKLYIVGSFLQVLCGYVKKQHPQDLALGTGPSDV